MEHNLTSILKKYWGFDGFRGSQLSIMNSVMAKQDVLALMPTGGGKSLCYQVPALAMGEGICIVVSPLIALMEDQLKGLKSRGIKALGLYGKLSEEDLIRKFDNARYGEYSLLYISPERLGQPLVRQHLERLPVNLIAIDEAHCISQWGFDFRPAYLECAILRNLFPKTPLIALTATATPEVIQDITRLLEMENGKIFKDSIQRPNLIYTVACTEDKLYYLEYLLHKNPGSAVIFVRTRKESQHISQYLKGKLCSATYFHGGLVLAEKQKQLAAWQSGKVRVMVATNAFGMGVDKGDVRLVVHYHMPETLEHYFQEAGRAGRDGQPALAVLLNSPSDVRRSVQYFLGNVPTVEEIIHVYRKLCNYFQIAYGELPEKAYHFNFGTFCKLYELSQSKTFNALELLDRNGVIALIQKVKTVTKVRINSTKADLFRTVDSNPDLRGIIQVLLRTYGGLFDFETVIQPKLLSQKLGCSESEITEKLTALSNFGLLELEQESGDLEVTYLMPREDERTIHSFSKSLEQRQELKQRKVTQMVDYVGNINTCRQIQLLAYFGENYQTECGGCDVCAPDKPSRTEIMALKPMILQSLSSGPKSSREIILQGNGTEKATLHCLQFLLEDQIVALDDSNKYKLL